MSNSTAAPARKGQLTSWVGLCQEHQESSGESRSDRTIQGNQHVRSLICQIAHAATRTKGSPWESPYQRWVRRTAASKALWAGAHW